MDDRKWKVGAVEILRIAELEAGEVIQRVIEEATPENTRAIGWLQPHFADQAGHLRAMVQSFLVRSGGLSILIDTGIGNDKARTDVPEWSKLRTGYVGTLRNLGVTETDIDAVICTHLHVDHVGWNTRLEGGRWVPTFPNARYLIVRDEYAYWAQKPEKEFADHRAAFDDSVVPIVEAGLVEFVDANHTVDESIQLIPSPGHTPAHVSLLIDSRGDRALISGDVLHHPCQIARPQWSTCADTTPAEAVSTRLRLLEQAASTGALLIGSHFAGPVAGHVRRAGDSFVLAV